MQNPVFGDPHQHAGRSDDRGVDGAGEHEKTDHHDKNAKRDAQGQGPTMYMAIPAMALLP